MTYHTRFDLALDLENPQKYVDLRWTYEMIGSSSEELSGHEYLPD